MRRVREKKTKRFESEMLPCTCSRGGRRSLPEMQTMSSQSHQGASLSLGPFLTSQGHNVFPIFREPAHSSHMGDLLCILTLATPCQLS